MLLMYQVVEVLSDALTLPETPVPTKVARLMLVSDILHNSTAPVRNASRYRSLLESAMPDIFESLQVCLAACACMSFWMSTMPGSPC
jgi:hypothetical protein